MANEARVVVALSAENKGAFEMFERLRKEQEKAKQGMESFNQQAQKTKAGMGQFGELLGQGSKLLGSFGLALSAGKIAMDTFKGAIASTQATADAYASATEQAKGATEAFYQTIATGDFSNLINNMQYAIDKAREYYEAYDKLQDLKWANDFTDSEDKARLKELKYKLKSGKLSKEEADEALKEYEEITNRIISGATKVEEQAKKAISASFKGSVGLLKDVNGNPIDEGKINLDEMLKMYVKSQGGGLPGYDAFKTKYGEIIKNKDTNIVGASLADAGKAHANALSFTTTKALKALGWDGADNWRKENLTSDTTAKTRDARKEWDKIKNEVGKDKEKRLFYLLYQIENNMNDNERELLSKLAKDASNGRSTAFELGTTIDEMRSTYSSKYKSTSTGATTAKVAKVDKEAEKRLLNEKIAQQQAKAFPLFDYERVKIKIDELTAYIKAQEDKLKVTVKGSVEFDQIQKDIETKKAEVKKIIEANGPAPLDMDKINKRAEGLNAKTFKAPAGVEDFTSGMQTMENSINSVANSFGAFTSLVDGSSEGFLGWMQNAVRAVTSVLPLIDLLTAKQAVSAQVATADAAAKGASSVAATPFVGAVLAVGAVASILGALAKTQKFATGGIVGGSSYYGDKILARVNSGELILNNRQQKALYEGLSPHLDRTQNINVGGAFKIQGKDLVLAYNRTTKQLNRN